MHFVSSLKTPLYEFRHCADVFYDKEHWETFNWGLKIIKKNTFVAASHFDSGCVDYARRDLRCII